MILFVFICNTFSLSFKHKSSEEGDICLLVFIRLLLFLFSFKSSDDMIQCNLYLTYLVY